VNQVVTWCLGSSVRLVPWQLPDADPARRAAQDGDYRLFLFYTPSCLPFLPSLLRRWLRASWG
jgi:hypothetical protein